MQSVFCLKENYVYIYYTELESSQLSPSCRTAAVGFTAVKMDSSRFFDTFVCRDSGLCESKLITVAVLHEGESGKLFTATLQACGEERV